LEPNVLLEEPVVARVSATVRRADRAGASRRRAPWPSLLLAALALLAFARWARDLLVPMAFAALLYVTLRPMTRALTARGLPRSLAALVPVALLLGGAFYLVASLNDPIAEVLDELPAMMATVRRSIGDAGGAESLLARLSRAIHEIESTAEAVVESSDPAAPEATPVLVETPPARIGMTLLGGSFGILGAAAQALLVLILVYFLLLEGPALRTAWVRFSGRSFGARRASVRILDAVGTQLERFLLVMATSCTLVAVVTAGLLAAVGLERALFWGVFAGIANLVPYLGPAVATIGVTAAALMQFDSPSVAVSIGGLALLVTSLEGWLFTPWRLGRSGRLSHTGVFVGILFWTWLWGVWGVFFAGPLTLSLRAVAGQIPAWRPFAQLLTAAPSRRRR
jgi:predicted PurR-regulated permease PerM